MWASQALGSRQSSPPAPKWLLPSNSGAGTLESLGFCPHRQCLTVRLSSHPQQCFHLLCAQFCAAQPGLGPKAGGEGPDAPALREQHDPQGRIGLLAETLTLAERQTWVLTQTLLPAM